ncbi:MAG: SDR family oxidoreductase [Pseudomonadales bacterium]|nr:SDR family oxidoreductase [Pseudomonadales bacterium]
MDLELHNKSVIITGAASGIGLACTRAFVAEGARVLAVDINAAALESVLASLPAGRALAHVADVTDAAQVQSMVDRARTELGSIDVMFSNAGGATPTPVEQQSVQDYRQIMALNFDSVFYCVHAALPLMLEQGRGCFLSTSSGAGLNHATGLTIYGAAKAAVASLMKSIAVEFGARGIRANAIAPGAMDTPGMRAWLSGFDNGAARFAQQIPAARMGTPEDIAQTAVFLASERAAYLTGAVIPVDGASHARLSSPQID